MHLRLEYRKYDPIGNTTALVASQVPRHVQPIAAQVVMDKLQVEQVGYIEPPTDPNALARFQMMGNELSGNGLACMGFDYSVPRNPDSKFGEHKVDFGT